MSTKIGIVALNNTFDRHAATVLCGSGHLKPLDRVKGGRRAFTIVKPLPDDDEYGRMRDARFTSTLGGLIEEAYSEVETVRDELQEWYDNLPESFQNGMKGESLQEAIDQLQQTDAPDVPEVVVDLKVKHLPHLELNSRADRIGEAIGQIDDVLERLDEWLGDTANAEQANHSDVDDLRSQLDDAKSEWESAEMPGMY